MFFMYISYTPNGMGTLLDLNIRFEPDFVEYKYDTSGSQPIQN